MLLGFVESAFDALAYRRIPLPRKAFAIAYDVFSVRHISFTQWLQLIEPPPNLAH